MTSSAAQGYAEAYATHYERRNLLVALHSYVAIVASYPGAVEAAYSRSQIRNIVSSVVPEEELLLAQVDLALQHLQGADERSKVAATNPNSISPRDGEATGVEALDAWEMDGGSLASRSPSPAGLKNQSGTAYKGELASWFD